MHSLLALFPLQIVVFPGEKLNLHIFEDRYKQLISDCIRDKATFGMPAYLHNQISGYGTELKISAIENTYPGGEMDVKTKGERIFKVLKVLEPTTENSYRFAEVEFIDIDTKGSEEVEKEIHLLLEKLYETLHLQSLYTYQKENFSTFSIAHHIGLTLDQEYELLKTPTETQRQQLILDHLQKIVPVLQQAEKLKERVKLNGHFKNLLPPAL